MSPPFSTVTIDQKGGAASDDSSFEYNGRSVTLKGRVEKDFSRDEIRLRGTYRTNQELSAGSKLAIQVYDLSGELLVRDLPRIPFLTDNGGGHVAQLDEVYRLIDWAIDFDTDSVVIQFNYILEGEYWYDIKYPDIELPSLRVDNVNFLERFSTGWNLIPRVIPRGVGNFLPSVYVARKSHGENYNHHRSVEAFVEPEKERREQIRQPVEASWSLGAGRRLAINYLRLTESGPYLVRQGYVWDGVQWYEYSRTDNLTKVWVVPVAYYFLGVAAAIWLLQFCWKRSGRIPLLVLQFFARGLIVILALTLLAWTMTNPYILLAGACLPGLWLVKRQISKPARIYIVGFMLLAVLETGWSFLYGNSTVSFGGFTLSLIAYSIILLPVAICKNARWGAFYLAFVTSLMFSNYMLLDLYYSFFKDYPTLRVIGYSAQMFEVLDSIWNLLKDKHAVSFAVTVFYGFCVVQVLREPSKRDARKSSAGKDESGEVVPNPIS